MQRAVLEWMVGDMEAVTQLTLDRLERMYPRLVILANELCSLPQCTEVLRTSLVEIVDPECSRAGGYTAANRAVVELRTRGLGKHHGRYGRIVKS